MSSNLNTYKRKNRTVDEHTRLKLLSDVIEYFPDGVQVTDLDGYIIYSNQTFREMFSFTNNDIRGKHPGFLIADTGYAYKVIIPSMEKKGRWEGELTARHKDGSSFPVRLTAFMIYDGNNLPFAFVSIVRNLAERRAEEPARESALDLLEANENLKIEIKVRKEAEKKLLSYQKQLQWLSSQLAITEEREKRKIAAELHDCIGQTLALTKIKLGLLSKSLTFSESGESIKEILGLIEQTIKETRSLTFELSPPILYELGLRQAIQWLVDQFKEKHGISIELEKDDVDISPDNSIRFIVFQAVRELLINVVKHSQATQVKLHMSANNSDLKIVVEDNGTGFSAASSTYSGYGLFNIRERMTHINGRFEIKSTPGVGTRVTLITPVKLSNNIPAEGSNYEKNTNFTG